MKNKIIEFLDLGNQPLANSLKKKHFDKEVLRFAVNHEYIIENIKLDANDEIAIFPPVSGG